MDVDGSDEWPMERRTSASESLGTGSPVFRMLIPAILAGSDMSRTSNCSRPMVEHTHWHDPPPRGKAQHCCKDARCAAGAADISASPIARVEASKKRGMSVTGHTALWATRT